MILWHDKLVATPFVEKRLEKYKKKVEKGKPGFVLYGITLAEHPEDLLDIVSCREFFFRHRREEDVVIVGLAASYDGAMELLTQILLTVQKSMGTMDVRGYYNS